MSLHGISAQIQNKLQMHINGGLTTRQPTHIYPEWRLITYQSPVCVYNLFITLGAYIDFTATSTDVERVFSQGRLLLSHVRNRLSSQSIRALMCLGNWSRLGLVKDRDIHAVTMLAEIEGAEEELKEGWDSIRLT
jgi:hypothetical protein